MIPLTPRPPISRCDRHYTDHLIALHRCYRNERLISMKSTSLIRPGPAPNLAVVLPLAVIRPGAVLPALTGFLILLGIFLLARFMERSRRSEERFRLALEASGAGWWQCDFRTDTLEGDPRLKAMYGPAREVNGCSARIGRKGKMQSCIRLLGRSFLFLRSHNGISALAPNHVVGFCCL
jgi:PAS domain-containing protein